MPFPKFQLLAFALSILGVLLVSLSLFVITDHSSIRWTTCRLSGNNQSFRWSMGLTHSTLTEGSGQYEDQRVSNCGSELELLQSFVDTDSVCESGKIMLGLGISSLVLAGLALAGGVLAMCKRYGARWMLASAGLFLLSSLLAGLGAGLYRERMQNALPNIKTPEASIQCAPEAGPIALTFIGCIFQFFACLCFLPLQCCLPGGGFQNNGSGGGGGVNASSSGSPTQAQTQGDVAFTTFSTDGDRDAFDAL